MVEYKLLKDNDLLELTFVNNTTKNESQILARLEDLYTMLYDDLSNRNIEEIDNLESCYDIDIKDLIEIYCSHENCFLKEIIKL